MIRFCWCSTTKGMTRTPAPMPKGITTGPISPSWSAWFASNQSHSSMHMSITYSLLHAARMQRQSQPLHDISYCLRVRGIHKARKNSQACYIKHIQRNSVACVRDAGDGMDLCAALHHEPLKAMRLCVCALQVWLVQGRRAAEGTTAPCTMQTLQDMQSGCRQTHR